MDVDQGTCSAGEGINDGEGDEPLFSLAAVKGRGAVDRVAVDTAPDAPDELLASSDDEDTAAAAAGASGDEAACSDVEDECAPRATYFGLLAWKL